MKRSELRKELTQSHAKVIAILLAGKPQSVGKARCETF
nr:MAG TPA: hypothetical protein [Caudoviricetes sp.]